MCIWIYNKICTPMVKLSDVNIRMVNCLHFGLVIRIKCTIMLWLLAREWPLVHILDFYLSFGFFVETMKMVISLHFGFFFFFLGQYEMCTSLSFSWNYEHGHSKHMNDHRNFACPWLVIGIKLRLTIQFSVRNMRTVTGLHFELDEGLKCTPMVKGLVRKFEHAHWLIFWTCDRHEMYTCLSNFQISIES